VLPGQSPGRRGEPPSLAKIAACLAESLESRQDIRFPAQDTEPGLRESATPEIPGGHDACGDLILFLPYAVEIIAGQGNEEGALL
jgi:hypothetical protein